MPWDVGILRGRLMMRKPNYDFERAQRNLAKEAKAQEKAQERAQRKQEQKLKDAEAAGGTEGGAGGGAKAPD